ncbi:MAG: thiamine pyrophosphate-binding protein [Oscillospiraceae bacterium]|nr:thiamine pyrophosphate-binding protein [Oscillospiraceae bacterium]
MIKLSDYVFQFLAERGVRECFVLPGGGAMHLVDSLGKSGMDYVAFQHEQGAACAAEAYGQHTGTPGFLLVTSGPGATNAITPVAAGHLDSTPMFVISGQAKRSDLVGDRGVRQTGSQELPVIPMVKPVTKYAVEIMEPAEIRYHLERAWHEATSGRMGPVWLSIPLDVQGAVIDEAALKPFVPEQTDEPDYAEAARQCAALLRVSKKPLLLAGNGIHLAKAEDALCALLEKLPVPVQTTWKSIGLLGEDHPLYCGHPGIMGDRGANLILQEADLLLVIGSRLDTSLTAFDEPHFGKNAKKIIVDIDPNEIARMNMEIAVAVSGDAKRFIEALDNALSGETLPKQDYAEWLAQSRRLRERYPVVTAMHREKQDKVSPYYFTKLLCDLLRDDDVVVPESSGSAGEITYQAFQLKHGQKMKNAAGLGSMGFGLPYSVGACIANGGRRTVLINGDGAFQLNIQELETLRRLNLPVKIFIWCNDGYASIRSMQRGNFGRFVASGPESGFTVPDFCAVAAAYGLQTFRIRNNREAEALMPEVLNAPGPVLCAVETDPEETVSPRVKAIPQPDGSMKSGALEAMWPELEK